MTLSHARVLVTTETLYHRKVEPIRTLLPDLEHVLLNREGSGPLPAGTLDLNAVMSAASTEFTIPATDPQETALLHFTSGTTGLPKGALHVHDAATLATDKPIREQIDLDSMDYLNFVIDLHSRTGVDIPEADYGKLTSIDAAVDYLAGKIRTS